ncbi:MAG: futalosine hydrolase [Sphingobacteriia bacterium]|nr:futalosine hydrolase [Sphingobacteriia bacterium]
MKVIVTAATTGEWMPSFLDIDSLYTHNSDRLKVVFHQSGVGMLSTAVSVTRLIYEEKPDLIIQAGIAGTYNPKTALGKVFVVNEENLGDTGVEEENKWKDIFDLKLEKSSYHPFEKRKLPNQWLKKYNLLKLPVANGITVNEISTNPERIQQLVKKYNATLESMEGAALHYVCREMNVPFLQIRSVSNVVGERDKTNWLLKESIENLNKTLLLLINKLYKLK